MLLMYNLAMGVLVRSPIKVADETFLVLADMHRSDPNAADFSIAEILDHARQMNLNGSMRPGVEIHIRQHCVANLPPNPGRYRMLFAPSKARRRLLLPGDPVHPLRDGKIWPDLAELPIEFHELVEWAKARYGVDKVDSAPFQGLLDLRGSGKSIWQDEPADDYVERLREDAG